MTTCNDVTPSDGLCGRIAGSPILTHTADHSAFFLLVL